MPCHRVGILDKGHGFLQRQCHKSPGSCASLGHGHLPQPDLGPARFVLHMGVVVVLLVLQEKPTQQAAHKSKRGVPPKTKRSSLTPKQNQGQPHSPPVPSRERLRGSERPPAAPSAGCQAPVGSPRPRRPRRSNSAAPRPPRLRLRTELDPGTLCCNQDSLGEQPDPCSGHKSGSLVTLVFGLFRVWACKTKAYFYA